MTVAADADGATLTITSVPSAAQAGPVPLVVHATAAEDTALVADASTDLYVAGIPGADDTSFGMDGFVELEVLPGRYATTYEAAVDGEGRLVVAGALQGSDPWAGFVVRVLPDGSFDDAFGDLGVVTGFGLPQSSCEGLVLDADAPVVACSVNDGVTADYYVRKLDENGDVDSTFGTGGDTPIPSGFRWFTGHVGGYLA